MNLRDYYSNYVQVSSKPPKEYEYSCISHDTGKKCTYKVYLINKLEQNVHASKLEEIEEILHEITNSSDLGIHHDKYMDYMIKTSRTKIKIEIVTEYNSKPIKQLNSYELSIFFYNLRTHIKDIVIAISYLKSRFIGDARWLNIDNLGFNPVSNYIVLKNFLNINFTKMKQNKSELTLIKEEIPHNSNLKSDIKKSNVINNFIGKSQSISFRSIRHSEFFDQKRCPYLKYFLGLCRDIMIIFQKTEDIRDYFNWNQELLEIEKRCFTLFLEDVFNNYKNNMRFRTEEIIKQDYFEAQSFKDLEEEFKNNLDNGIGNCDFRLIVRRVISYWRTRR